MLIKRVGENVRIKPIGAHSWFVLNGKKWFALKKGETVEIPDKEAESVFAIYGDSIVEVKPKIKTESKGKEEEKWS